jgi:hypothetical protein
MDAIKNEIVQEDIDWLESDLSNLDNYEPYEWQEGELQEGLPVKFIAETSWQPHTSTICSDRRISSKNNGT